MILARLTYVLEYDNILSPVPAGFRPGRSTVDQIPLFSQAIANSFHQSKPSARTVFATVYFLKTFHSVWHSAFFLNSSSLIFSSALSNEYNLIF